MATTVQQVLNFAYAKSLKNQPTQIADEATELLEQVNRTMAALYAIAAAVNPTFFGKKAAMVESSLSWPEPTDALNIYYMDQSAAEVIVVNVDEQDLEPDKLQVISYGRTFYAASTGPPAAANIDAYYAKAADVETALGDSLDATWDEAHNDLLINEIALFLAVKDGRAEEYDGLFDERDRALNRYILRLENQLANVRSRYGPGRFLIPVQRSISPSELLIARPG